MKPLADKASDGTGWHHRFIHYSASFALRADNC
jgi:hypothetical protein